MAQHAPAALSVAKRFKRLPSPNDSEPKLQLSRTRELLDEALQVGTTPELPPAPAKVKRASEPAGLMTVKQVALLCGISDKTVYRLASEGSIPYIRIQASLRFRRRDVDRWIEAKSFQPKAIRKTNPGK